MSIRSIINIYFRDILFIIERLLGVVPDTPFIKLLFYIKTGKKLNLDKPKGFCEKIQWIKIHDRNPEYIEWSDKLIAKQKAAGILGDEYIIPTISVYDRVSDIDYDVLPEQFVIKCNHDSGGVIVCRDKKSFDMRTANIVLKSRIKRNFYYHAREWAYKDIKPKIFVEKYMSDRNGELINYKFYCFNGQPQFLYISDEVIVNGDKTAYLRFLNLDWTDAGFGREDHPTVSRQVRKPDSLDEMIMLAKKLSRGIPFVRTDFYDIDGVVYFSELTFYPGGGFSMFYPDGYEKSIGEMLRLPER